MIIKKKIALFVLAGREPSEDTTFFSECYGDYMPESTDSYTFLGFSYINIDTDKLENSGGE